MEKIYMENNKKKKSKTKQLIGASASVKWSFALSIIALFSILAAGFSNISYAIPDVENPLPDTFTAVTDNERIIGTVSKFSTTRYYVGDTNGIQVFCLENNINFVNNIVYNKGNQIVDYGLLYIMANSYPNVQFKNGDNNLDPKLQSWITQVAIWIYQKKVGAANSNNLTDETIEKIKTEVSVYDESGNTYDAGGKNLYTTYIEPLVTNAIANQKNPNKDLVVTKEDDNISITSDEKYYQTSLITVTGSPAENFNGYAVSLTAPEGSMLVDESGKEITDTTNLTASTKFYVRVPKDKVTEENKKVIVSVTGSFKTYEGNYYVSDDHQTITSVKTVNNNLNKGLEIELNYTPETPDTASTVSRSIYFIGLIILLSGAGIIYANVKPKESK